MEEEWPYPLLSKEIDARHRAKKISDGNSCSSLAVLIPRTTGWWGIDPRWKPRQKRHCWQKRQADNRGNANGPSHASYASCKARNDSSNGSRCANLTLARRICTICRAYSVSSTACTYIWHQPMARTIHGLRCFDNFIDIYIASVGSFRPELMSGFRPYTASYGDMSSFGGGSSLVPIELRTSQTDDAPHVTQPTQPEVGKGNDNDPRRSNRERHEPNRLSLSGPRHAAGQRKKNYKKARWNI
uniref:Uncharacterized protein n=1 Tax=Oryza glumipatula TaxID=40148 RepID=A0A0E0AU75_9ORYZ